MVHIPSKPPDRCKTATILMLTCNVSVLQREESYVRISKSQVMTLRTFSLAHENPSVLAVE